MHGLSRIVEKNFIANRVQGAVTAVICYLGILFRNSIIYAAMVVKGFKTDMSLPTNLLYSTSVDLNSNVDISSFFN